MDSHSVPVSSASERKEVRIGGIVFDHVSYDADADVLYVRRGDAHDAVDWIGTTEGDGTSHAADGSLIGLTILSPKWRLEHDGKIELTLPEHTVVVTDLGGILD